MSQRRSSGRSDAARAATFCFLVALLTGRMLPALAADRDLLLAVVLNARPLDTLIEVRENKGEVFVLTDDFAALGLVLPKPPRKGSRPVTEIALSHVRGVTFRIDEPRQMLMIQADDQALAKHVIGSRGKDRPPDLSDVGLLVNYDIAGIAGSTRSFNGIANAQLNLPVGTFSSAILMDSQLAQPVIRLSSNFTYPDWDGERDWVVGDIVSGGLSWTRPFRLGGVQLASAFDMRPDVVTTPIPVLSGRAAVPSSVDVLVNGIREYSDDVQPGPFIVRQPPVLTGAGDITLVTRDAIGQQSVQTVSFYASPALLAQGLASYSMEAGLVRTGYGTAADTYARSAGSASLRYGITDLITGEAHVESGPSVQMSGVGAALNVANLGILTLAAAESRSSLQAARRGGLISIGFDHVDRRFNISASLTARSNGFRDVPAATGDPVPLRVFRSSAGVTLGDQGTFRAAYIETKGGLVPVYGDAPLPSLSVGSARIGSLTYTRPIGLQASVYATAYRDFAQHDSAGLDVGISIALGSRRSVDLSGALSDGKWSGAIDATQAATVPGQFGARLHLGSDPAADQTLQATYLSQYAQAGAGVDHDGRQNTIRAQLQGALVLADGGLFAASQVADSYAVVDTQGQPGIPVLSENRFAGVTDSAGRMLVPNLRGYDDNRLSIDPSSLPGDVLVDEIDKIVRPAGHGGVAVRFRMTGGDSALIRLVDPSHRPIPPGSGATLARTRKRLPIGFDGELFATGLQGHERLLVTTETGDCVADFAFRPVRGEIPTIGPVVCTPAAAR